MFNFESTAFINFNNLTV